MAENKAQETQRVSQIPMGVEEMKAFFREERLGEKIAEREERYGLSWAGKSLAKKAVVWPTTNMFRLKQEESKDAETTRNLFLEGDNLEVLKLLMKRYFERVKMIYIDPPYNTGKDFIYKDNFTEGINDYLEKTGQTDEDGVKLTTNAETNGRYHSDWLTMMASRLTLARKLLREDGVIFVSIDDNEVANLRLLMDEVFGEENYLNTFCWVNNLKGRQISNTGAAKTFESILCYAKDIENACIFEGPIKFLKGIMPDTYKGFDHDVKQDAAGSYVVKNELYNTNSAFNEMTRPKLVFTIQYNPITTDIKFSDVENDEVYDGYTKIFPKKNFDGMHRFHAWRWSREKILRERDDLLFVQSGSTYKIYTKIRDHFTTNIKDIVTNISTTKGRKDIEILFDGNNFFDYPKPVDLLRIFIGSVSKGSDIILDFFAGSGTTAHAVMAQNAEDGGNRKFILVQIPERTDEKSEAYKAGYKTIADIAKERIRRAGKKVREEFAEKLKDRKEPLDTGFRVFSLGASNYRQWEAGDFDEDEEKFLETQELFVQKPLVDGYREEDVVYETMLKEGFSLTSRVSQETNGNLALWRAADFGDGEKASEDAKEGTEESPRVLLLTFAPKVTFDDVLALKLAPTDTFVCFDSSLTDSEKVNIVREVRLKVM